MTMTNHKFYSGSLAIKKHKGSAIVLAIFIMIVVMLFGTTIVKIFTTGSETIVQEVLGTRALAAANSAMQGDLQKIFPLDNGTPSISCPASPAPAASSPTYDFTAIEGLYTCTAKVSCSQYAEVESIKYYRLVSTGTCGDGTITSASQSIVKSSRTVRVEARSL